MDKRQMSVMRAAAAAALAGLLAAGCATAVVIPVEQRVGPAHVEGTVVNGPERITIDLVTTTPVGCWGATNILIEAGVSGSNAVVHTLISIPKR